jgi:nicotinamide phosphoribosyltransferase
MQLNPLHACDFYKTGHRQQYPKGTTLVYSNFTARSNKLSNLPDNNTHIVFFGLQYFCKDFLQDAWSDQFFSKDKDTVVAEYKRRMDHSLGKDSIPVDHIEALHELGYLPIEIRALPEGTLVPMKVPCFTIHNTLDEFFWLTNYLESVMSAYLWKASVSATTANWYRQTLNKYAEETGGSKDFVPFQGHDFSFRGMSGPQDAALSGAGHLLSFVGTDTVLSIDLLEQFYGANCETELVGCSVPATEHSVMTFNGQDGEEALFDHLISHVYPKGIVSIVSDSFDFWKVLTTYLPNLKGKIMERDGKVVIRPDSGDPVKIICGTAYKLSDKAEADAAHLEKIAYAGFETFEHKGLYYTLNAVKKHDQGYKCHPAQVEPTPEMKGAVQCLWEVFGGKLNTMGFKELDSHIGLIYGDSITPSRAISILNGLKAKGFVSTNVVFGIGSFTYQYCTRDTYGFAVKATFGVVDEKSKEIYKDPKTGDGLKKSAKGILAVREVDGVLTLFDQQLDGEVESLLVPVFSDGNILVDHKLSEIRARLVKENEQQLEKKDAA